MSTDQHEEARFLAQPTTPKSERRRNSWGSLLMSVATVEGLCALGRKCIRANHHVGACWPTEEN